MDGLKKVAEETGTNVSALMESAARGLVQMWERPVSERRGEVLAWVQRARETYAARWQKRGRLTSHPHPAPEAEGPLPEEPRAERVEGELRPASRDRVRAWFARGGMDLDRLTLTDEGFRRIAQYFPPRAKKDKER